MTASTVKPPAWMPVMVRVKPAVPEELTCLGWINMVCVFPPWRATVRVQTVNGHVNSSTPWFQAR